MRAKHLLCINNNICQRFGVSKMHLRTPRWLRLLSVLRWWLCCCWFDVGCYSHWCVGPCFVMHYLVSFLVLQSFWQGRESWLLYFNCLPGFLWLLVFWCSSSWCVGWPVVCDWVNSWSYSLTFGYARKTKHGLAILWISWQLEAYCTFQMSLIIWQLYILLFIG